MRRRLVSRHRTVIAFGLAVLGREILDRLVVQQAVHGLLVGVLILVVHLFSDCDAPFGDLESEADIGGDRRQHDGHVDPSELDPEDDRDDRQFDQQRHDREHQVAQQKVDRLDAAVDGPG